MTSPSSSQPPFCFTIEHSPASGAQKCKLFGANDELKNRHTEADATEALE